jgi:hypothetical protein
MPLKARDADSSLTKKGFRTRNSKDKYYHFYVDGKKTAVYTFMSQGEREIHDGLVGQMCKQVKLNKKEFLALIECTLSEPDYRQLLEDRGHIAKQNDEDPPGRT